MKLNYSIIKATKSALRNYRRRNNFKTIPAPSPTPKKKLPRPHNNLHQVFLKEHKRDLAMMKVLSIVMNN